MKVISAPESHFPVRSEDEGPVDQYETAFPFEQKPASRRLECARITSRTDVLLVDPSRLFREGMRRLLEQSSFNIVAECGHIREARVKLAALSGVDLLLLDLGPEDEQNIELLQEIRLMTPAAKVVLLSASVRKAPWAAIFNDIDGLLRKDISSAALLRSLEIVMLDEKVFPITAGFLASASEAAAFPESNWSDEKAGFSLREIQILHHLRQGSPNKVIARELNVAETTVKAHVKAILRKIKADNRTQAAIWSLTNNLPDPALLPSAPAA